MTISFLNVLIGLILGNLGHVAVKDPTSSGTPTKFSLVFFIKDNYIKVLHSIVIACILNFALQINLHEVEGALGLKWYNMYSIGLGLFPDAFLSFMKNKFGWMQPKSVKIKNKTYKRKDE